MTALLGALVLVLAACTSGGPARSTAPAGAPNTPAGPTVGAPGSAGAATSSGGPSSVSSITSGPATTGPPTTGAASSGFPPGSTPVPVRAASVHVLADCATPSVRPTSIVVTCADAGIVVNDIRWLQWGDTSATATASLTYNECRPNCAQGHDRTLRDVRITLTDPVPSPLGYPLWSRLTPDPTPQGFGRTLSLPTRPVG